MERTFCQSVSVTCGRRKLSASLTCLCCLTLVLSLVLYLCDECIPARRFYTGLGEEPRQSHNTYAACDYPAYTAKSWTTSLVTNYRPSLSANCTSLWAGDAQEVARVQSALASWNNSVSDEAFLVRLRNCTYVQDLLSDNLYMSSVEKEFPVAFLFTVHDYPQQVLRLLRVLYRPHNVYCFHVDAKAKVELIEAFRRLSVCVPNILMPKELISVYRIYGESILEAQLSCLEMLHSAHATWQWKYVMNLCGTELPLLTNSQIVERLERLNGSTYIPDKNFPDKMRKLRFDKKYKTNSSSGEPYKSNRRFGRPPFNMQLYKSSTYSIMSYNFTHFVLTHPKAISFRKYIKGSMSAEEHFYISLYHLPEAPIRETPSDVHTTLSTCIWMHYVPAQAQCNGRERHGLCIAGVGTMNTISNFSAFFFNKYLATDDHVVMNCLEERIVARNKLEQVKDCTLKYT